MWSIVAGIHGLPRALPAPLKFNHVARWIRVVPFLFLLTIHKNQEEQQIGEILRKGINLVPREDKITAAVYGD